MFRVCLESLSRIYAIASVPIVDCFQKIRQQVDQQRIFTFETLQIY
jgi:hypothetical protein